ncbi:DNA-binding transcriptional regulator, ArsR family [Methylobacterium sp. yr596]|jgi:DNA-binding transcriptional ArsR family regulator|nr:DNA-binding transcriptional regulator, ArsR family [Methylobacterium sp. yr596]
MRGRVQVLSPEQVGDVAEVFRLLGEPNRLRIVLACLETERTVGEIGEALGLSQSLTSHHLRLLRTARILRAIRHGRHVAYAIDDDHVRDVLRNMVAHLTEPHDHDHDHSNDHDRSHREEPRPMTSTNVETVKCACEDCVCTVPVAKAVSRDGKAFCCEECAEGHPHHAGCDHAGCTCHG